MKKYNTSTLLISLIIYEIALIIFALAAAFFIADQKLDMFSKIAPIFAVIGVVAGLIAWALNLAWGGSSKKAKKTFTEGLTENGFKNYVTFEGNDAFLAIDNDKNRIAYVANSNPKQFQMANKNELSDIVSDHNKAPMGGTSGVYFSFKYNGKKTKVYTYLTNGNASLKSQVILEAISKADYYAELLQNRA